MSDFKFYGPENATGEARDLLINIKNSYGFIPNMFAYMAEAPVTIQAYLQLNELVAKTSLTTSEQQIALLTVSLEHECKFCSVAHQAIARMKKLNTQSIDSLVAGKEIENEKDRSLVAFTQSVVRNRGKKLENEIEKFLKAGFTKKNVFEVILIVTIKTLSNYTNHIAPAEPNKELLDLLL